MLDAELSISCESPCLHGASLLNNDFFTIISCWGGAAGYRQDRCVRNFAQKLVMAHQILQGA